MKVTRQHYLSGVRMVVVKLGTQLLSDPEGRLEYAPDEPEEGFGLAVQVLEADDKDKLDTLFRLLCHIGARPSIIFCNHRDAVERTGNAQFPGCD